jgi:hypothetical protein
MPNAGEISRIGFAPRHFWENIGTSNLAYAAQYLACTFPGQRITSVLAEAAHGLGSVQLTTRFTVMDFHRLPPAGLPARPGHPIDGRTSFSSCCCPISVHKIEATFPPFGVLLHGPLARLR